MAGGSCSSPATRRSGRTAPWAGASGWGGGGGAPAGGARTGSVARFGNVIGSRGSLVPAALRYKALRRPIPITDERMTRFFMGCRAASDLALAALLAGGSGEGFTPAAPRAATGADFLAGCRGLLAPG